MQRSERYQGCRSDNFQQGVSRSRPVATVLLLVLQCLDADAHQSGKVGLGPPPASDQLSALMFFGALGSLNGRVLEPPVLSKQKVSPQETLSAFRHDVKLMPYFICSRRADSSFSRQEYQYYDQR